MKSKLVILLALGLFSSGAYSQTLVPRKMLAIPADMAYMPGGSANVPLPDNPDIIQNVTFPPYYVSKEVTNKEYKEFVNDIRKNPTKKLTGSQSRLGSGKATDSAIVALYSNIVKGLISSAKLPYEDYLTNEKYDNYPAIGISEKNTQYYAVWRYKKDYAEKVVPNRALSLANYNIPEYAQKVYIGSKNLPVPSKERMLLNQENKGDFKGFYFVMVVPTYKKATK